MNVVGVLPAEAIGGRPLLAYSVASALLGGQALSLGLLAELIVAYSGNSRDWYSVSERCLGRKTDDPSGTGEAAPAANGEPAI
jgi:hypothetical protein